MVLDDVVTCAAGIRIAQRGATGRHGASLRVGSVATISRPTTPALESHRADGLVWRRHWSEAERLVIEFSDLAIVQVDHAEGVITVDRDLPAETEQHLLLDHVLPLVLAHHGHVVLHGGVVSLDGSGAVLVGSSGAGKSTLAAFAWSCGWVLGGDDGAVLSTGAPLTVQPTYATLRLHPDGARLVELGEMPSTTIVGKHRYAGAGPRAFRLDPVEVRIVAIIEPVPVDAEARFERLRGIDAHAELFGSTFHAEFSGGRLLPAVVDTLATVVETTTVGRLSVPRGVRGLAVAESLLRDKLWGRRR